MGKEYEQVISIIELLNQIVNNMKITILSNEDIDNVVMTIAEVNNSLYGVERLKFQSDYDISTEAGYECFVGEVEALIEIWRKTIEHRESGKEIDKRFWLLYETFKYILPDDIYVNTMKTFFALPEGQRIEYLSLKNRYTFLNNTIDITENDYSLIVEHIEMMAANVDKFRWLYEHLCDYRSKYTLIGIIEYWFDFNINKLHRLTETVYSDYYDLDIVQCGEDEVFVDLGAYTGDSVRDFIQTYGEYKMIYAYELSPSTFHTLERNTCEYSNIELRQKGVSSKDGYMYMNDKLNGARNKILDEGDTRVEVVALDSDIKEKITLVKMDIEGAEKDAIIGMKNHIENEKPKLMISSYHIPEDIFEVPNLINSIRDDYKFYMRFNGCGIWPCDYVLFAV